MSRLEACPEGRLRFKIPHYQGSQEVTEVGDAAWAVPLPAESACSCVARVP